MFRIITAVFVLVLLLPSAFAQGVSVRSTNGFATNLTIRTGTLVGGVNLIGGTNLARTGVTGLEPALTFLTNSIGTGGATNAIGRLQDGGTNTYFYRDGIPRVPVANFENSILYYNEGTVPSLQFGEGYGNDNANILSFDWTLRNWYNTNGIVNANWNGDFPTFPGGLQAASIEGAGGSAGHAEFKSADGSVTNVAISETGVVAPLFTGRLATPLYINESDVNNLVFRIAGREPNTTTRTGDWSFYQQWYTNVGSGDVAKQWTWGFNYDPLKYNGKASSNEFGLIWSVETFWDPFAPGSSDRQMEYYGIVNSPSNAIGYRWFGFTPRYNYTANTLSLDYGLTVDAFKLSGKTGNNDDAVHFSVADGTNNGAIVTIRGSLTVATNATALGSVLAYGGGFNAYNASGSALFGMYTEADGDANLQAYTASIGRTLAVVDFAALSVPDLAYNATTWDGSVAVPTRNAIRDKIESLVSLTGMITNQFTTNIVGAAIVGRVVFNGEVVVTNSSLTTYQAADSAVGVSVLTSNGSGGLEIGNDSIGSTFGAVGNKIGNPLVVLNTFNRLQVDTNLYVAQKSGFGFAEEPVTRVHVVGTIYGDAVNSDTVFDGNPSGKTTLNLIGSDGYWALRTGTAGDFNLDLYSFSTTVAALKHDATGLRIAGNVTATNGFASRATTATIAITASGWTNSYAVNAVVDFDAGAADLKYFIKNSAGVGVYTNLDSSTIWHATAILQPGGALVITGGTTPTGTARQF